MIRRRGFTLIEMVTVMGVTSLIAVIATSVLLAVLQQQSSLRTQLQMNVSHAQLARSFREDVHRAATAKVAEGGLRLAAPQGEVTYEFLPPDTIRRTRLVQGAVRFDDFWVQADCQPRFTIEQRDEREFAMLVIAANTEAATSDSRPSVASARNMTALAELGRDRRWLQTEESPCSSRSFRIRASSSWRRQTRQRSRGVEYTGSGRGLARVWPCFWCCCVWSWSPRPLVPCCGR